MKMDKTPYTDEELERFLDRMAEGMPVTHIEKLDGYPTRDCIYRKARRDPEFLKLFDVAREQQMTCAYDSVHESLDDIRDGKIDPRSANAWVNAVKVTAENLAYGKYGQRQRVDHTSSDGSMTPKGRALDDFYAEADSKPEK